MWRNLVLESVADCVFFLPATAEQLALVERDLDSSLPSDLKSLLEESNGVMDTYGLHIVWNTEEIRKYNSTTHNQYFRERLSTLLLFFADAGNGDEYAVHVTDHEVQQPDIYVWRHEDDRIEWVASSLKSYIESFKQSVS